MPTAAYEVGSITVTKDGTCIVDNNEAESIRILQDLAGATTEEPVSKAAFTVSIPLDKVKVGNLTNLLESKGYLIKHALHIDDLRFELNEDSISFPWFSELPEPDEVHAYSALIAALCKMSKEQKRISATEKPVDNERYSFRCFLLRLGFIGDEYKTDRRILMRYLPGNSAFKGGVGHAIFE
nr:MAG TPA: hypothetical protein [Caudoviricetes sp.]